MESRKGTACPYKPITCQEVFCSECQVYLDFQGHQNTMGRTTHKEQADKLATLTTKVREKRAEAFAESNLYSANHRQMNWAAMVAYDVVLRLIKEVING